REHADAPGNPCRPGQSECESGDGPCKDKPCDEHTNPGVKQEVVRSRKLTDRMKPPRRSWCLIVEKVHVQALTIEKACWSDVEFLILSQFVTHQACEEAE